MVPRCFFVVDHTLDVSDGYYSYKEKKKLTGLVRPLASSIFAPGVPKVQEDFNDYNTLSATFIVSVFVLGFAFGPLVIAPCSELYGRNPVYHVCNVLFVLFSLGCALATNMSMLTAFRFCSGFAGVAVVTCGAGSIADIMPPKWRGRAISIWSMGPMLGPTIGPVVAGFVIEDLGWRWAFWIVVIAVSVLICVFFFPDVPPPPLRPDP